MDIQDFIEKFAEAVEIENASGLNENTQFQELDDWSSLGALSTIAMVEEDFGIVLKGEEIRNCNTIGDIFKIIQSKK